MPNSSMSAVLAVAFLATLAGLSQARSLDGGDAQDNAVIPSPNQEFNYADELVGRDIQRRTSSSENAQLPRVTRFIMTGAEPQEQASNEASVPVYVSPFERAERSATVASTLARPTGATSNFDDHQESSHAPPNYAPRPAATASTDLKTSASYGK